jgi:mono/diheme cytochrome c family protein
MTNIVLLIFLSAVGQTQSGMEALRQGEYLTRIAGCRDCHSTNFTEGMAGGSQLISPFGTFFTPNITPDIKTGIGSWRLTNFIQALRFGLSPDNVIYYPTFPYRSFSKIANSDMAKMYAYIMSQPPVERKNKPHQLASPFNQRWLLNFWQFLFFKTKPDGPEESIKIGVGPYKSSPQRSNLWNRGAYLVEAFLHCAECHTPRNSMGGLKVNQWMAGSSEPIDGLMVPNITPAKEGLADWTKENWNQFLTSGYTPEFKSVRGEMSLVLHNTASLTAGDRAAVIEYLMQLKPVSRSGE